MAEHLAEKTACLTLFATHYFELTELAQQLPATVNVHVEAQQYNDDIVFLHRVSDGAANQSFGLQVAKLAGVPAHVIAAAKRKLSTLEQEPVRQQSLPLSDNESNMPSPEAEKLYQQMTSLEVDDLTPKQALDLLFEWKKALD